MRKNKGIDDSKRLSFLHEYLKSDRTSYMFEKENGLSSGSISRWLCIFVCHSYSKKLRCQVVTTLADRGLYKVSPLCKLLGINRQVYYKHTEKSAEEIHFDNKYCFVLSIYSFCRASSSSWLS